MKPSPASANDGRARRSVAHARAWFACLLLFASAGASCPQLVDQYRVPVTRVLPEEASLDEIIAVVNGNSARIESLYTTDATISAALLPKLKANIAFERHRRFRLFAETALLGTAVDLGSNDELFWFTASQSRPPVLYYCRHDEFAVSPARDAMAIEPQWLVEALGVASFEPHHFHHGPYYRGDDTLEIRTDLPRPGGNWSRVTVIEAARGWVLEQQVLDAQGGLVARARGSQHRRDPLTNVTLPHQLEIEWPSMQLAMKIQIGELSINGLDQGAAQLWTLPEYSGWERVDLARARLQAPPAALPTEAPHDAAGTAVRPQPRPFSGRLFPGFSR